MRIRKKSILQWDFPHVSFIITADHCMASVMATDWLFATFICAHAVYLLITSRYTTYCAHEYQLK